MLEFCETEKSNIYLVSEEGDFHHAYIRLPDGPNRWLEISIRPCNYPALLVQTITVTDADLAVHINKEFDGWIARKMNLEGVAVDDGRVFAAEAEYVRQDPVVAG